MVIDVLRSSGRSTSWELVDSLAVNGDVGHPQGVCRWGGGWLVSTVHPGSARGEMVVVAADGEVLRRVDVTDGERFHPGGFNVNSATVNSATVNSATFDSATFDSATFDSATFDSATVDSTMVDQRGCWIAVAEYRPRSTTTVMRLDAGLATMGSFPFDDHLGAICSLGDGSLFAVSWASRRWYRLDTAGRILDQRTTPTRWIDLQDIAHVTTAVDGDRVVATGVGGLQTPAGPVQLGGLVVIDVDAMSIVHDTPIAAWMPSGRVATYNGAHLTVAEGPSATLHCLVDDTTASIGTWVANTVRA